MGLRHRSMGPGHVHLRCGLSTRSRATMRRANNREGASGSEARRGGRCRGIETRSRVSASAPASWPHHLVHIKSDSAKASHGRRRRVEPVDANVKNTVSATSDCTSAPAVRDAPGRDAAIPSGSASHSPRVHSAGARHASSGGRDHWFGGPFGRSDRPTSGSSSSCGAGRHLLPPKPRSPRPSSVRPKELSDRHAAAAR